MSRPKGVSKYSRAEHGHLAEAYLAGATAAEVGEKFGMSGWAVHYALRAMGVPRRPQGPRERLYPMRALTLKQQKKIVHRYKNGESLRGIAPSFGVTPPTVVLALERHGVRRRPRGWPEKLGAEEQSDIIKEYKAGRSGAEIGKKYKVWATTVYRVLSDAGVPRRPCSQPLFSPKKCREMATLYQAGQSSYKLAGRFHTSVGTICRTLERLGVARRPRGRPKKTMMILEARA